jgi:DNA-binding CsgD family transcriptional regulator
MTAPDRPLSDAEVGAVQTYLHLGDAGLVNADTLRQLGIDHQTVNRYLAEVRRKKEAQ